MYTAGCGWPLVAKCPVSCTLSKRPRAATACALLFAVDCDVDCYVDVYVDVFPAFMLMGIAFFVNGYEFDGGDADKWGALCKDFVTCFGYVPGFPPLPAPCMLRLTLALCSVATAPSQVEYIVRAVGKPLLMCVYLSPATALCTGTMCAWAWVIPRRSPAPTPASVQCCTGTCAAASTPLPLSLVAGVSSGACDGSVVCRAAALYCGLDTAVYPLATRLGSCCVLRVAFPRPPRASLPQLRVHVRDSVGDCGRGVRHHH
jgi:hypothetical protein